MLYFTKETEHLLRLVAAKRGSTPNDVLRHAIEQQARIEGVMAEPRPRAVDMARIDEITARSANRPLLESRTPREILDDVWGRETA